MTTSRRVNLFGAMKSTQERDANLMDCDLKRDFWVKVLMEFTKKFKAAFKQYKNTGINILFIRQIKIHILI